MDVATGLDQLLRVEREHEAEVAQVAGTDMAPAGAWAARDHIAHFGLWRRLFVSHVQDVLADKTRSAPPDDLDAANDRQLEVDRAVPVADIVQRWQDSWTELHSWLAGCSTADLEHVPEWYQATSVAGAVVRNSYTHPCGHLVDFHVERARPERAAQLADEMADAVMALSALDFRFPAGAFSFRAVAFALRGQADEATRAVARAVELRPGIGPALHDDRLLASLRGRADFEDLTRPR